MERTARCEPSAPGYDPQLLWKLKLIAVINFHCSFPRTDAVQCRRYLQHVCDTRPDNRCARFWGYVVVHSRPSRTRPEHFVTTYDF